MSTPVTSIDVSATGNAAWNEMRMLVGVVASRDLAERRDRLVAELMSRDVVTADPETTVRKIVTTSDLFELLGRSAIAPSPRAQRWTLKQRGQRKRPHVEPRRGVR